MYGLNSRSQSSFPASSDKGKELNIASLKLTPEESSGGKNRALYRPPHLRKDSLNKRQPKVHDSVCLSDQEPSVTDFTSSDSDYSDADSSVKDADSIQSFKVRVATIVCLQVSILKFLFTAIFYFHSIWITHFSLRWLMGFMMFITIFMRVGASCQ